MVRLAYKDSVRKRIQECEDDGIVAPDCHPHHTPCLFERMMIFMCIMLWRDINMLSFQLACKSGARHFPDPVPEHCGESAAKVMFHQIVQRYAVPKRDSLFYDRYYFMCPLFSEDRESSLVCSVVAKWVKKKLLHLQAGAYKH